jgi:hypothetical protein
MRPDHPDEDVTGMGKAFMDRPLIAILFGAAVAFGGGALGASVPPRPAVKHLTPRQQVVWAVGVYGPVFVLPVVVWLATRDWIRTALWTGLIWITLFFGVGLIAIVRGYRHSKAGRLD